MNRKNLKALISRVERKVPDVQHVSTVMIGKHVELTWVDLDGDEVKTTAPLSASDHRAALNHPKDVKRAFREQHGKYL